MNDTLTDKKLKIAIQGYEGSFHQLAAESFYQQPVDILPSRSFTDLVTNTMNSERCDEAVMAIENSIAGSILSNYNLLQEANLSIKGEVYIRISQHLMALPGTSLESITEVHSHPMAILQCRKFFKQYPHIKLIETEDTALSAKNIRDNNLQGIGAIASHLAAEIHDLEIVRKNIETVSNNYTRFFVLTREPIASENWGDSNKASLHFNVSHQPGCLVKALNLIAEAGVNLSKIQSTPIPEREWEYSFHIDIEFDSQEQYLSVIEQLTALCQELKVLGVYKNGRK